METYGNFFQEKNLDYLLCFQTEPVFGLRKKIDQRRFLVHLRISLVLHQNESVANSLDTDSGHQG